MNLFLMNKFYLKFWKNFFKKQNSSAILFLFRPENFQLLRVQFFATNFILQFSYHISV